jgi:hypothetical protein
MAGPEDGKFNIDRAFGTGVMFFAGAMAVEALLGIDFVDN